ncbi:MULTISPECIES: hypothetical protein [unclassified Terrabacter]|uniref:hypothetical protein n=1 Tax=unclassified Terrabacter TaxID=2630222 RepID=UPI003F9909E9
MARTIAAGEGVRMRWDRLFDDLEAQLALDDVRELEAEVADRTRRERALLDVHTRLLANVGATHVGLRVRDRVLAGRLVDVGPDWALVETAPGRPVLVALPAVRAVSGLAPGARTPSVVARRFGLGAALRAVSRDRAVVEVVDVDGHASTGTIDVVGSDHLEIAEHAADEARRAANVTGRSLVPFWSLGSVRRL